ncbi:hypothetical protein BGZ65_000789 [Modicella reniformis]|uniref:Uncharacterized protein n=1 Tax=Modicella reniformis TaxID=1440133 RepID=A0A9P6MA72_9FUNG|nr:hypothetical protein BGZ65_000789 [Modicella reniformis]
MAVGRKGQMHEMLTIIPRIAAGALYDHQETLDIRSLLPPDFEFRDQVNSIINVAQLNSRGVDDLSSVLSQGYLQRLYTNFLGLRQARSRTGDNDQAHEQRHHIWDKLTTVIKEPTDVSTSSAVSKGLSHTIVENIRHSSPRSLSLPKNFKILPLQKRLDYSASDHSTSASILAQDEVIDLDDDGVDEEDEVEELNVEGIITEKEPSIPHVALRAPLVVIANTILRARDTMHSRDLSLLKPQQDPSTAFNWNQ